MAAVRTGDMAFEHDFSHRTFSPWLGSPMP
jgi:hypothetical protein